MRRSRRRLRRRLVKVRLAAESRGAQEQCPAEGEDSVHKYEQRKERQGQWWGRGLEADGDGGDDEREADAQGISMRKKEEW